MSYGRNAQRTPEEVNSSGKDWFTLYAVFKRASWRGSLAGQGRLPSQLLPRKKHVKEFDAEVGSFAGKGLGRDEDAVELQGVYDVSGMRADADVMVWLVGHKAENIQAALRALHRTHLLARTEIAFSAMGVHRTAEFARGHVLNLRARRRG